MLEAEKEGKARNARTARKSHFGTDVFMGPSVLKITSGSKICESSKEHTWTCIMPTCYVFYVLMYFRLYNQYFGGSEKKKEKHELTNGDLRSMSKW
jgi:hypothetical protein